MFPGCYIVQNMNNPNLEDGEVLILQNIQNNGGNTRQRDLARVVGKSLGMTNAILKRLVKRGLLIIKKINNRTVRYAVSPAGINAITRKSYHYLKRTLRNVVYYKDILEKLVMKAAGDGFEAVVLLGGSDLDFIIEHLCQKHRVGFIRAEEKGDNRRHYYVYSENFSGDCAADRENSINLGMSLSARCAGMAENEEP
jgi:DNA-binding MarR family transcriptional regulator